MYHQFNIHQFYIPRKQPIYVFCVDLRKAIFFPFNIFRLDFITDVYTLKPSGHYMYHQFNIEQFYVLPTHCTYVLCVDLRPAIFYPFNIIRQAFLTDIYPFKAQ